MGLDPRSSWIFLPPRPLQQLQVIEPAAKISTVGRGEAIGMNHGMGRDQKIRYQVFSGTAASAIAPNHEDTRGGFSTGPRVCSSHSSEDDGMRPFVQPNAALISTSEKSGRASRKGEVSSKSSTSPAFKFSRLLIATGIVICPLEVSVAFIE
jgi:hypothetical protein